MNKDIREAIRTAQTGRIIESRRILARYIKNNPRDANAWYVLSFFVENLDQREKCLRNTLKFKPNHLKAKESLQKLNSPTNTPNNNTASIPSSYFSPPKKTKETNHRKPLLDLEQEATKQTPSKKDNLPVESVIQRQRDSDNSTLSVIRIKPKGATTTLKQTNCLWHSVDQEEDRLLTPPNITKLLFDDIAKLPIVTNPHQEIWLGVQLKASQCLTTILASQKSKSKQTDYRLILSQHLFDSWNQLEQSCYSLEIPSPRMEAWAAELLSARKDIYHLHRSTLLSGK